MGYKTRPSMEENAENNGKDTDKSPKDKYIEQMILSKEGKRSQRYGPRHHELRRTKEINARRKMLPLQTTWTYFKGMPFEKRTTEKDEWNGDAETCTKPHRRLRGRRKRKLLEGS